MYFSIPRFKILNIWCQVFCYPQNASLPNGQRVWFLWTVRSFQLWPNARVERQAQPARSTRMFGAAS
jgi:hypothetical protein